MKRFMLLLGIFLAGVPLCRAQSETPVRKVAILEVVDRDNTINYGVKLLLRTTLAKTITQTPGYEGYDRVDMGAILGEQDFQRTGMVSDDQIKRLGEMTGAAYVLVAEAAKIDAANMIVTAKILDVETARLERTDYEQMGITAKEMAEGCQKMAGRLLRAPAGETMGNSAIGERKMKPESIFKSKASKEKEETISQQKEPKEKVEPERPSTVRIEPESNVIWKGRSLIVEDKYMVRTKMTEREKQIYLGNFYRDWRKLQKIWTSSMVMMPVGGTVFTVGLLMTIGFSDNSYYEGEFMLGIGLTGIGAALGITGIVLHVGCVKKMNRILQTVNEQHGIAPYQTAVTFNVGNQPHGIGFGLRF